MNQIETVRDLIAALLDYNLDAKVAVGNNMYNHPEIFFGTMDGCTAKTCDHVFIGVRDENPPPPVVPEERKGE